MHFAIIEYTTKLKIVRCKATIEKLREDNSLSLTGDNEIDRTFYAVK